MSCSLSVLSKCFKFKSLILSPGEHCHCSLDLDTDTDYLDLANSSSVETNLTCLDISTSLSWTVPPSYQDQEEDYEDILTSVHVVDVAVTVGFEEVTAVTADVLPSPTVMFSSIFTDEPELGIDIDMEGEIVSLNNSLFNATWGKITI